MAATDARVATDATAARDARAATDARALHRFAAWCIQSNGWRWWRWELSLLASTHIGAVQLGYPRVDAWAEPLYSAFLSGAWLLHWTDDTLFWAAKPVVRTDDVRRLHCGSYAALESDVENVYFWHGVIVPAFVVLRPDWITPAMILQERNAEVRRVMIERFGQDRFICEAGARVLDRGHDGELIAIDLPDDPDGRIVALKLRCPSTHAVYIIRVPPDQRDYLEAKAWTFGLEKSEYRLAAES